MSSGGGAAAEPGFRTGRRHKPSKGDIREATLLRTARDLLSTRPWSVISVDDLARGAGLSRSSFYFYFDSREGVLLAIAEEVEQEFLRADEVWFRRAGESPHATLQRAIDASFSVWRRHGPVLRAVVDARDSDPAFAALRRQWAERFVVAVADQIERERSEGHTMTKSPPARDVARMLLTMTERVHYEASKRPMSPEAEARLSETLTTIWHRAIYGTAPAWEGSTDLYAASSRTPGKRRQRSSLRDAPTD